MRRSLLVAWIVGLLALANAAPAGASNMHSFLGVIAGTEKAPLRDACGVAADAEGNRYLADYYHLQIPIFNYASLPEFKVSSGKFSAAGSNGLISESGPVNAACALAVDSSGRLYADLWHGAVVRYLPGVYPFPTQSVPSYGVPVTIDPGPSTGVAVDRATNRLYVAHRTYIAVYEPTGAPVMEGGEPLQIGAGPGHDYYGLAVSGYPSTAGRLYVADAAAGTVLAFDPASSTTTPVQTIDGTAAPQGGFVGLADTSLAVDDSNGSLLVVDDLGGSAESPTALVDEFGPGGEYLGQLPRPIVFARPSGLAVDNSTEPSSGLVYVTSGGEEESTLLGFCPTSPSVALAGLCSSPPPTHLLRVTKAGAGAGSVSSSPGWIGCGVICAWEFTAGSSVTLTATPQPHSSFTGWSVSGATPCPGTGSCKVTLNGEVEVTATFSPKAQRTLTVARTGNGDGVVYSKPAGIWCGSVCSTSFDQGTTVLLLADPAPGSRFAGWSGAGCAGDGACQVTTNANSSVTAAFEAATETSSVGAATSSPFATVAPPKAASAPTFSSPRRLCAQRRARLKRLRLRRCSSGRRAARKESG